MTTKGRHPTPGAGREAAEGGEASPPAAGSVRFLPQFTSVGVSCPVSGKLPGPWPCRKERCLGPTPVPSPSLHGTPSLQCTGVPRSLGGDRALETALAQSQSAASRGLHGSFSFF